MAKFELQLPEEIMRDIKFIHDNYDQIFGAMTQAGADVVMSAMQANLPEAFKTSNIMGCLRITKTYKTPSDDGINNKVGFYGYFTNRNGEVIPAPLVANVFEYGRSNSPFPKHPFLRKSFRASEIERAMLQAQREASGGLLE